MLFVYFTIGIVGGQNKLYYSCADENFTRLVTEPKLLGFDPPMDHTYIDGDISLVNGTYNLFTSDSGQTSPFLH